jgi:cytochrome c oxidase assembly factor CtaG
MPPEVHAGLTLALLAFAVFYLRGWQHLRRSLRDVLPAWRFWAFMTGLLVLWTATGSPLAALDHQFLTVHMVQHLLLMTVAAPLILLGAPLIVFLHALPHGFVHHGLDPFLKWRPVRVIGRTVTHPVFCWLASTAAVIGWHTPALFAIGMHSGWHAVEHATFFAAGLLFWWPVVQPWPSLARWPQWSMPLYLFLATLPCDALSAFLTFCNRVVYPHYLSGPGLFGSPLGDQECAGALMWVTVTFAYLAPAVVLTMRLLSPQRLASKAEVF